MDSETAKELLGGVMRTAEFFNITPGAVSQWDSFPPARELELMRRRPDIYEAALRAAQEKESA